MKAICRLFILLAVTAGMLTGCSLSIRFGDFDLTYEYDTEWAAAYYYGYSEDDEAVEYRLELIVGRTDDDNNLTSYGSKASLVLNAPEQRDIDLPDGTYSSGGSYTISLGRESESVDPDTYEFSYVEHVDFGTGSTMCCPVEQGVVEVRREPDGEYEIKARLTVFGSNFDYEYEGPMDTYDLSDLQF